MAELKRVCSGKVILIFLLGMFLNICIFVNTQLGGDSFRIFHENKEQYLYLLKQYEGLQTEDALDALKNDMQNMEELEDKRIGLYPVRKELLKKLEYLSGYPKKIQTVLQNTESLKKKSLFANKESYAYHNLLKTGKDFQRVEKTEVLLCNDKAVESFLEYSAVSYVMFFIMLFVIFQLCAEREIGLEPLVRSTAKGRRSLAAKRFAIIAFLLFVLEFVMLASTLMTSIFLYGTDSLRVGIQTIEAYQDFTFPWNQMEYILAYSGLIYMALFAVCIFVWMIYTVFVRKNIVTFLLALASGIELILYQNVDIHGPFVFFKRMNIFSLFDINEISRNYENCKVGSMVISVMLLVLCCIAAIIILSVLIIVAVYGNRKAYSGRQSALKVWEKCTQGQQKILTKVSLWIKELHKLIFTSRGYFIVLGSALLMIFCTYMTNRTYTSADLEQLQQYIADGGEDYSIITQKIDERKEAYEAAMESVTDAAAKYQAGEMEFDVYYQIFSKYTFYQVQYNALSSMIEKYEYVEALKENEGINAWMILDTGYDFIFGPNSYNRELLITLISTMCVFLLIINCMTLERTQGMQFLLYAAPNGRSWLNKRKVCVCLGFILVLEMFVIAMQLWWLYFVYGFDFLNAPVYSLSFMNPDMIFIFRGFTIGQWMILFYMLHVIIAEFIAGVSIALSGVWMKKKHTAGIFIFMTIIILIVWLLMRMFYHAVYL